jgi:putative membrane protein
MLRNLLIRWAILAVAVAATAALLADVDISGGFLGVLWVAALFGLVNAIIGSILRILTLPITVVTLGLFALVVNGVLLAITAGLTSVLSVGGFLSTIWAALLISVFSAVLNWLFVRRRAQPVG